MSNPSLKFDLVISDDVSNVANGGMMGHARWRVAVYMLELEMATGVQDSQLCLFCFFVFFFVYHLIAHSCTVNTSSVVYGAPPTH